MAFIKLAKIRYTYKVLELTSIGKDYNSIRLHKPTGVLIFCSYHPSAYTKSVEEIYDSVMYHYRAFLEGHY